MEQQYPKKLNSAPNSPISHSNLIILIAGKTCLKVIGFETFYLSCYKKLPF